MTADRIRALAVETALKAITQEYLRDEECDEQRLNGFIEDACDLLSPTPAEQDHSMRVVKVFEGEVPTTPSPTEGLRETFAAIIAEGQAKNTPPIEVAAELLALPPVPSPQGVGDDAIEAARAVLQMWDDAQVDHRGEPVLLNQADAYYRLYKGKSSLFEQLRAALAARPLAPPSEAADNLGKWLSAALDDPAVCEAMKADVRAWFDAGQPFPPPSEVVLVELFNAAEFAARIRVKMEATNQSFRDAAPAVGVSVATLNRVARGNDPDVQSFLKISRWLGPPGQLPLPPTGDTKR
jgi:hypothetical protein